mmetsp:Transcript_76582/g.221344  ORF Transcript_76582/g.221344 Transcript_76582/m.221344 type:complete len:340 (-) Transcript_76582:161-1180(-)
MASKAEPVLRRVQSQGRWLGVWDWPAHGPVRATIVLAHATGFHSRCWDEVVRRLPKSFRCLCVDLPGHGLSDMPSQIVPRWGDFSVDLLVALRSLAVHPQDVTVLVGHSMGGWVSVVAAAMSPEPFPALLLVDPVIQAEHVYTQTGPTFMQPVSDMVSRRKDDFNGPDDMFFRFRRRLPYSAWTEQALRDYCDFGLAPPTGNAGAVYGVGAVGSPLVAAGHTADDQAPSLGPWRLRCRPAFEAACYVAGVAPEANCRPHLMALAQRRQRVVVLRAPREIEGDRRVFFQRSPTDPATASWLGPCAQDALLEDADHFIPMTNPQAVVEYILSLAGSPRSNL